MWASNVLTGQTNNNAETNLAQARAWAWAVHPVAPLPCLCRGPSSACAARRHCFPFLTSACPGRSMAPEMMSIYASAGFMRDGSSKLNPSK